MCLLCCIMLVIFPVSERPVPEGCPVCPTWEELKSSVAVDESSGLGVCEPLESVCRILCACPHGVFCFCFLKGRIHNFHSVFKGVPEMSSWAGPSPP